MQRSSAQKMEMYVEDGLAGAGANVVDRPVSTFDSAFAGQLCRHQLHVAQQLSIRVLSLIQSHDMLFGNNQDVCGRLRLDVLEGKCFVIFVDFFRWDFPGNDLAEKAIGHKRNSKSPGTE